MSSTSDSLVKVEEGRGVSAEYEMVKRDDSIRVSPDIEWFGLSMTTAGGKKILSDTWGSVCCALYFCVVHQLMLISTQVKSGTVTGLLGASGAGKSSLLNILSGRLSAGKGIEIEGKVRFYFA